MTGIIKNPVVHLTAPQVRARFGNISDMTLWRWLNDESMAFPKPLVINRRRLFKESDIVEWEARRSVEAAA